ncbi:MAG: hypothetical protein V1757_05050, partial [Actinomycetota bacterium]
LEVHPDEVGDRLLVLDEHDRPAAGGHRSPLRQRVREEVRPGIPVRRVAVQKRDGSCHLSRIL